MTIPEIPNFEPGACLSADALNQAFQVLEDRLNVHALAICPHTDYVRYDAQQPLHTNSSIASNCLRLYSETVTVHTGLNGRFTFVFGAAALGLAFSNIEFFAPDIHAYIVSVTANSVEYEFRDSNNLILDDEDIKLNLMVGVLE